MPPAQRPSPALATSWGTIAGSPRGRRATGGRARRRPGPPGASDDVEELLGAVRVHREVVPGLDLEVDAGGVGRRRSRWLIGKARRRRLSGVALDGDRGARACGWRRPAWGDSFREQCVCIIRSGNVRGPTRCQVVLRSAVLGKANAVRAPPGAVGDGAHTAAHRRGGGGAARERRAGAHVPVGGGRARGRAATHASTATSRPRTTCSRPALAYSRRSTRRPIWSAGARRRPGRTARESRWTSSTAGTSRLSRCSPTFYRDRDARRGGRTCTCGGPTTTWSRAAKDAEWQASRRRVVHAAARHAVDFQTWRSLVRDGGVSRAQAVKLASAVVLVAQGQLR